MSGSGSQVHASREGGRKKDSAWLEVNDIENEKGKVMCKFCEIVISKKIERVREHLSKCKKKYKMTNLRPMRKNWRQLKRIY